MSEFKEKWDLQMALDVLQSQTVDGELWSQAVKWLLLYGPPELQELIQQASSMANQEFFPDLKAKGFTDSGEICYEVKDLAEALGISEEEAATKINELEQQHGIRHLFDKGETNKVQ